MSNRNDLAKIAEAIEAMLSRFRHSGNSLHMDSEDEGMFRQFVLEAKVLLDEEFGRIHDFSRNLVAAANVGVANFVGSPSHHSVQTVAGILRVAVRQVDRRSAQTDSPAIPASDRYVALSDNQREGVFADLSRLKEEVRGSNSVDVEERLISLSEIAAFEGTIIQPRISIDLIQRFVDVVIQRILRTFTAAAAQDLAQRLIHALRTLVAA